MAVVNMTACVSFLMKHVCAAVFAGGAFIAGEAVFIEY